MTKSTNVAAFVALSSALVLSAEAQTPSDPDLIVVEGTRLRQTLRETGTSASVITSDEIERSGFDFLLDTIATAPGVTTNASGGFGGQASVRLRGASSAQTLVLVDGVPVNDPSSPSGGFDFARFDTANVERVEILRGPQSVLWGTDAMGGVVSIITKTPGGGLGSTAFAEAGSFGTVRAGAALSHGGDRSTIRLAGTTIASNGISKADEDNGNTEEDNYDATTLSAKAGFQLGGAYLSTDILYTDSDTEFDGPVSGAQGGIGDGRQSSLTEELTANVSLTGTMAGGRLDNLLLAGYADIDRRNFNNNVPGFSAEGERLIFRYQGTFTFNETNTLAFGAEREEVDVDNQDTALSSLFALYEWKPLAGLTLTGGLRHDDHERFGGQTTGRVAASYNPSPAWTVRGSWGQGFKAPTLFQTTFFCCGADQANAALQPETSVGYDLGVDWRSANGRWRLSLTYFDLQTDNQIDFLFAQGTYVNIDEVNSRGIELSTRAQLTDSVVLSANYTYIDAEDESGLPLARLPEHAGNASVSFNPQGPLSGAVLLRYNGDEQNTDGTVLDGWTRVDLSASYAINERVELFGRLENVVDTDYQQVLGYGTPDRSGMIGLRLRYGRDA